MSQQTEEVEERGVSWRQHLHQQHSDFIQVPGVLQHSAPTAPTQHPRSFQHCLPNPTQLPSTEYSSNQPSLLPHNVCYPSSGHPETYSVLPVGHGNFLKVYHTVDSDQPQIMYNNYELFSSNLINQSPSTPALELQINEPSTCKASSPNKESNVVDVDGMHFIPTHPPGFGVIEASASTTNMIINKLVNNWSPNLTGTYTQFEDQSTTSSPIKSFVAANSALMQEGHYTGVTEESSANASTSPMDVTKLVKNATMSNITKTNGNFEKSNTGINIDSTPKLKKRIVAEVKPMRMSYSDVLSKINNKAVVGTPNGIISMQTDSVSATKSQKSLNDKLKISGMPTERVISLTSDEKEQLDSRDGAHRKQGDQHSSSNCMPTSLHKGEKKRLENKENIQNFISSSSKNTNKITSKTLKGSGKQTPVNLPTTGDCNKKKSTKRDENLTKSSNAYTSKSPCVNGAANDKEGFYNVAKTDNQFGRFQKYTLSQHNNPTAANSARKGRQTTGNSLGSRLNNRFEKQQMYASNRRSQNRGAQKKSTKYEVMKKLLKHWLLEYTVPIFTWLFYLFYDVIVIGFSIVYERLFQLYTSVLAYFLILRQDIRKNSDKPSVWIRNYLKKVDSKFPKKSKWAFWRKFYYKTPAESSTECYKTGRLPQTGEEAMYSLLNCKGKDAYSILGVPPNSSQEQIRKHYKKIAVLVHPDKNKQAGAEEAFKVLQRAFELVGEPENRVTYDQSLVEALHAEKAWTELHDLLSQLQTKIAEAANTIRCSSCGLRHPRKITERPHYAARECGSCKIRHSAREGDIWAETSWLRLRWKYLASMEGKVYDITEWANCQKGALSHLEPNSHMVQYRIVRGGQQQQQQQQHQKQQTKFQPPSGATLDDFLDNLYSGQNPHSQAQNTSRRRARRN